MAVAGGVGIAGLFKFNMVCRSKLRDYERLNEAGFFQPHTSLSEIFMVNHNSSDHLFQI